MSSAKLINLSIDDTALTVAEGTTIMSAAETIGIHIPRLCYHPCLSLAGSCRVCIVEVEGMPYNLASCSVTVAEGMRVKTNSSRIRQDRRDIVELLLDNHPRDCQICERDGHCELQNIAYTMGVRERLFAGTRKRFAIDASSRAVVRNPEKCILCGRCVRVCAEIQGVSNLSQQGRGFTTFVAPAHAVPMDQSVCIQCGQCINACPVAAFLEQKHVDAVYAAIDDPQRLVIAQTAPSIRAAIGEGFGLDGQALTGKMISALRRLGVDKIFDTDLGADLTIIEESSEFLQRLANGGPLPMFTSCSPGWINFLEKFYPGLIAHASSCRSPMTMLSTLTKTYFAETAGIDPAKIFMVAIMPCVAKKFEAARPELQLNNQPLTDAVLTTRELIWMLKGNGIKFADLPDSQFDNPLGQSTGAGDIFGVTGGVMEASLRTACEKITGKPCDQLDYENVRGVVGAREAEIVFGKQRFHIGIANGLQNAKKFLDQIERGQSKLQLIEIMACPSGCSGGGGQPYPPYGQMVLNPEILAQRGRALYSIDAGKSLRRSHENPQLKQIYADYLGEVHSPKAQDLLHTCYSAQLPRGIR